MDITLKDFIKTSLADIADAVAECQQEFSNGAVVSPALRSSPLGVDLADFVPLRSADGVVFASYTKVRFEVNLEIGETHTGKNGIGVAFSVLVAGTRKDDTDRNIRVTNIKFDVPLILPLKEGVGSIRS